MEPGVPSDPSDDPVRIGQAVAAAGLGAWDWNLRDRTAWYSEGLRSMLRHGVTTFPDRFETFANHVHPEDLGRVHGAISSHLQRQAGFDLEFRMRCGDGLWKWVRARGTASFDGAVAVRMTGMMSEWPLAAARDRLAMTASDRLASALEDQSRVTRELEQARAELVRQNEALRQARVAAEAATESKAMFLANMSHEIRTPMTAILGFLDVLLDESADPAERRRLRNAVRRSSDHLLAIINDVLDVSKIEAGGMSVERVPTSTLGTLADVLSEMQSMAREKGLDLGGGPVGGVPATIQGDPLRLRQILTNLVGNAIKFTEHGGVHVEVRWVRDPAPARQDPDTADPPTETGRIQYRVIDTGSGIGAEQADRLFRPFVQGDASTTRRHGGTGLGLVISRRLARLLGGDLRVESVPGRGSTFIAEVGTGQVDAAALADRMPVDADEPQVGSAPASGEGAHVLLAEDGEDNQRLIAHHLRRAGMRVTVAANGREAIDLATAAARQGRPHDLILMDMQMPEVDGYEATRHLRSQGWKGPIAALTAHAMSGDRERCLEAGCDRYITKPVDRETLLAAVRGLLARAADA